MIKLTEDAVPYLPYTPRNLTIALREKVKIELNQMEKNCIISRVTEQTFWCVEMVVVAKNEGSV